MSVAKRVVSSISDASSSDSRVAPFILAIKRLVSGVFILAINRLVSGVSTVLITF
jgi:hypothetical protein